MHAKAKAQRAKNVKLANLPKPSKRSKEKRDMKPSELLELHREEIKAIVLRNHGQNPRVFGSVLAGTDTEESDLDILIEPLSSMSLFDIGAIRYELKELLKIEVDVLTPGALPSLWKDEVLQEAKPI